MKQYALCVDSQSCLWIPSEFNCWSISPCRENKLQLQLHRQGSVNNIKVEKWAHSVQCKCQFRTLSDEVQSMKNSKYAIPMSTTQSHVKSNLIQRIPSWFVWVCLHLYLYVQGPLSYHRPRNHWRKIACSLPLSVPLLCYKDAARHATEAGISRASQLQLFVTICQIRCKNTNSETVTLSMEAGISRASLDRSQPLFYFIPQLAWID